jgi:hypothetical protein
MPPAEQFRPAALLYTIDMKNCFRSSSNRAGEASRPTFAPAKIRDDATP